MLRLAIIPACIVIAIIVAWRSGAFEMSRREQVRAILDYADGLRWVAPTFVLAYVVAIIFGLPTTIMIVVAGAIFGTLHGAFLTWSGALLGTAATHVIGRSVGHKAIQRLFGKHRLLERLRKEADLWSLMRLRVLPVAPFGVLVYAAALAGVALRQIVIATSIAIVPGTLAYAYAGERLRVGIEQSGRAGAKSLMIAAAVTLVMTAIAVAPSVMARFRRV